MPANIEQELDKTSAIDQADSSSSENLGAEIICDRVDQKIQNKLPKQIVLLENKPVVKKSYENIRGKTIEPSDPEEKNNDIDADDTDAAKDTNESSENDSDTDEEDKEREDETSEDSEQDEDNSEPSLEQHPSEWVRRRRHIQTQEQRNESWLLVVFALAIIAFIVLAAAVFGLRIRDLSLIQGNADDTIFFHEQIFYYLFPKLL